MKVNCTTEDLQDGTIGGCVACGQLAFGVEPDARKYPCEACGEKKVYGLEELLIMGMLNLEDGEEE